MTQRDPIFSRIMPIHVWLYRKTGGRIGGKLVGIPHLLLYTVGRKSGKQYTIPLAYHPASASHIVVASNSGFNRNPGWYHNVLADPNPRIQVMADTMAVSARELTGDEYDTMWAAAIKTNPRWDGYRQKTRRHIPLIALTPG